MEKKSTGMSALGAILGQCVTDAGAPVPVDSPVLSMIDLVQKWPVIVGDFIAEKAFPTRLRRGTLTLQTVSTIWSNELQLLVPRLLDDIGEQCPQLEVTKIRFTS